MESIAYQTEKIKQYLSLIFIVILAFLALGLWQLHAEASSKTPLKIVNIGPNGGDQTMNLSQTVIGSKTGTKYYFPWCGALARIKPENRVEFASPALAKAAGYLPAGNCKGVQ